MSTFVGVLSVKLARSCAQMTDTSEATPYLHIDIQAWLLFGSVLEDIPLGKILVVNQCTSFLFKTQPL